MSAAILDAAPLKDNTTTYLNQYIHSGDVPGLQYVVVTADRVIYDYAGGWANVQGERPMTLDTTMMGYSMTKTITAVAILQLAEQKKLNLDDLMERHLSHTVASNAYSGRGITIRQLMEHTSGIPNPIPLQWAHLASEDSDFDEDEALAKVLKENGNLAFEPGTKYAYSNIGYWLLGKIIEQVSRQSYRDFVRENIFQPLQLPPHQMDFIISDETRHAKGYLKTWSFLNWIKGFLLDSKFLGDYERWWWLSLNFHYLNGPAFGGIIGTALGFARFLQDQLQQDSVLLGADMKRFMLDAVHPHAVQGCSMTMGWHIGTAQTRRSASTYLYKEGGGAGYHGEMRIYPTLGIGTVVLANSTTFSSTSFLNRVDRAFLDACDV